MSLQKTMAPWLQSGHRLGCLHLYPWGTSAPMGSGPHLTPHNNAVVLPVCAPIWRPAYPEHG